MSTRKPQQSIPKLLPPHPLAATYKWSPELRAAIAVAMKDRVKRGERALVHDPVSYGEGDAAVCLDGNKSSELAHELGFPFSYTPYQGEEKDIPAFIAEVNDLRRHEALTLEERRKRLEQAIAENKDLSDRAIAAKLGVDHKTVGQARKATGDNSPVKKRIGKDGKPRRMPQRRMTQETQTAIAEHIEKCVRDDSLLLIYAYNFCAVDGGNDYTVPQIERVLKIMRHDGRILKVGGRWKWNNADHKSNGKAAEPTITEPAQSETAQAASDPGPTDMEAASANAAATEKAELEPKQAEPAAQRKAGDELTRLRDESRALEMKIIGLESENGDLKRRIEDLERENERLKGELQAALTERSSAAA